MVKDASVDANATVRRAFLKIDPATTLQAVDSLDLRAHAKVSAVVGVPLRQLQQRRDVEAFATTAPILALKGLLELLVTAPLEAIIALLGDHAETPTYEQMVIAVDAFLAEGGSVDDAIGVLAFAVGESFAAAPHCRRLLEEREDFLLPVLPESSAPSVLAAPREVSPEIREQRRARREEEKRRKKASSPSRPPRPTKMKGGSPKQVDAVVKPAVSAPTPVEERRPLLLTPLELSRFDAAHPLVGTVVVVTVPFDATDPEQPEVTSKDRPALVVAASSEELLVRPLYSSPSPSRSIFQPWRRLGLDHVSYVDDTRVSVANGGAGSLTQLGSITTPEWNALR